jgi:hypothetical protein
MRTAILAAAALTAVLAGAAQAGIIYSDTFNRPDSNDLGTNNNGLGGTISAPWVSKETDATAHKIQSNKFQAAGGPASGADSYINHNFTAAELGTKFSVTLDLGLAAGNDWFGLLLGMDDTKFATGTTITSADVPLGFVFRGDNLLVTWDNANNGSGQAALTTNGKKVKVEVDSAAGYGIGAAAKVRLYTSTDGGTTWTQFNNLRNQGLSEYNFTWTSGKMYIGIESMNSGTKTVDNLTITNLVPEPGTFALLLSGVAALGLCAWRKRKCH